MTLSEIKRKLKLFQYAVHSQLLAGVQLTRANRKLLRDFSVGKITLEELTKKLLELNPLIRGVEFERTQKGEA